MSVAELHPEELFDKLAEGALSDSERERLLAHLQGCTVCRFDYSARLDFQSEADSTLHALAPDLALRPARQTPAPPLVVRRRPSRVLIWGIAAAVMICGSGALAAWGEKPWRALGAIFVSEASPAASGVEHAAATRLGKPAPEAVASPAAATADDVRLPLAAESASEPSAQAMLPARSTGMTVRRSLQAAPAPQSAPPFTSQPVSKLPSASPTEARTATLVSSPQGKVSPTVTPASAPAEPSGAAKLFAEANQARRAGQVGRASGLYHLLQEQYPGSSEAELSRVTLATLLLNGGDASGALAGFEHYLAGPSHALEAEALVGRARALQRLGRQQLEIAAWREVQHRFPGSVYARQAAERLAALEQP